jgi:hypothetical protein
MRCGLVECLRLCWAADRSLCDCWDGNSRIVLTIGPYTGRQAYLEPSDGHRIKVSMNDACMCPTTIVLLPRKLDTCWRTGRGTCGPKGEGHPSGDQPRASTLQGYDHAPTPILYCVDCVRRGVSWLSQEGAVSRNVYCHRRLVMGDNSECGEAISGVPGYACRYPAVNCRRGHLCSGKLRFCGADTDLQVESRAADVACKRPAAVLYCAATRY